MPSPTAYHLEQDDGGCLKSMLSDLQNVLAVTDDKASYLYGSTARSVAQEVHDALSAAVTDLENSLKDFDLRAADEDGRQVEDTGLSMYARAS